MLKSFGITDKGKVRKDNQDSFIIEKCDAKSSMVVALCDGMGGAKAGGLASQISNKAFVSYTEYENAMQMADKYAPQETTVEVRPIINRFFGESVTVTGLITGGDLVAQCADVQADEILICRNMIRAEGDMFLDDMTLDQARKALPAPLRIVENSGEGFWRAISGMED